MNPRKTTSTNWPLVLIAIALVGAGFSYHFTLESRFASIEQKLDQNSTALQQYEASQEALSSKAETLDNLAKKVDALQASLEPLSKATRDQTDALSDIRKQIASLQQSQQTQQAQQDSQKKLSDEGAQLEKIRHDNPLIHAAQTPPPLVHPSTPSAPAVLAPHASAVNVPLPFPPRADSAVDIRAAQSPMPDDGSVRVLPVALPVSLSTSENR